MDSRLKAAMEYVEAIPYNKKNHDSWTELWRKDSRLRYTALAEEETLRIGPCRYKWEIGSEIYKKLTSITHMVNVEKIDKSEATQQTMMGYPVEINHDEKDVIKLWREVRA